MLDARYQHINELVNRSKSGDGTALGELRLFYNPLFMAALKRCYAREPYLLAHREDIESELILILHDLIVAYDPELSYFSYYLSNRIDFAILSRARRLLKTLPNGQAIVEEINFSDMPIGWEPIVQDDPFGRIELRLTIQSALEKLSRSHYEVIDIYFFKDIQQKEAAKTLGITQASFSRRLSRALEKLKIILHDE